MRQGRLDEGLEEFLKARELDPLSSVIARLVALPYYLKRDYARALELLQQANELGPAFSDQWEIGVYIQNRLFDEALAELEKAKRERKNDPILIYSTGMVYAARGERAEALQIIKELEEMSGASLSQAHWIAKIYAALNEKELALKWLERGLAAGAIGSFIKTSRCGIRSAAIRASRRWSRKCLPPIKTPGDARWIGLESEADIAVLPFENLSEEKSNAYFADGIQDEILTALSKISGLKVISRSSTAYLKSKPQNLADIARELGVRNILEGSVQKAGDHVHINVQLIQAESGGHLWAQSYDRTLTDTFGVEGEVAKSVADSLKATLTPQEIARVNTKPTNNSDAYVLYLRAIEIIHRAAISLGIPMPRPGCYKRRSSSTRTSHWLTRDSLAPTV